MDEVISRIKEYIAVIDDSIIADNYLDLVIQEVIDRVLIYTNRGQLLADFESEVEAGSDITSYPIPPILELPIARAVVQVHKSVKEDMTSREVSSIKDGVQSITFGTEIQSYMATTKDAELFLSMKYLLDKFRIPTIVGNI
jgi:hypothetical protein